MIARARKRIPREIRVARRRHAAHECGIDAAVAQVDEIVDRGRCDAQIAHAFDVLRIDAVVTQAHEIVRRNPRVPFRGHAAHILGIHAMIAQPDERIERAEAVAEIRHCLDVVEAHAMLRRSDERMHVRHRVAVRLQAAKIGDADIFQRQLKLLQRVRRAHAAPREFGGERRVRRESERTAAHLVAAHALERERARVAAMVEVHRAVDDAAVAGRRGHAGTGHAFEARERQRPAGRHLPAAQIHVHHAWLRR